MSKSKGNVVDPNVLLDKYGVDAIRYFLLREISTGSDGYYSEEALVNRINIDLANDYGNLVSRSVAMIDKYFEGVVPSPAAAPASEFDADLKALAETVGNDAAAYLEKMDFPNALASIWKLISRANKYIDETAPWVLAKDESKKADLGTVLYNLMECIRISTILLAPFMPLVPGKVAEQTGQNLEGRTWADGCTWGNVETGVKVCKKDAIFPRIDPKSLDLPKEEAKAEAPAKESKKEVKQEAKKEDAPAAEAKAEITYDDFAKLDLRVVEVLECSKVEKADKLLQFKLKMGDEIRTVVSGIAKFYENPEALIGKKLVLVANLAPKKIRGIMSHGMLLSAATDDDSLLQVLQVTHEDIPSGSSVC